MRDHAGMDGRFLKPLTVLALTATIASLLLLPALADDDAERARESVEAGEFVALEDIIRSARLRFPGRVVEVELDDDDDEYEIEILMDDGTKVELEYDARTGDLLEVDKDD
jgi:uncharacterized membrane protein YkoI